MAVRRAPAWLALALLATGCQQVLGIEDLGVAPDALPPGDDRDGDRVADADDNCPDDANTDQNDEDLDRLGDVCDPCPPFEANADPDQDGVGGPCDPIPDIPGDRIVLFDGFGSAPAPPWEVIGNVGVEGGDAVIDGGDMMTSALVLAAPPEPRIQITADSTLVALNATADQLGSIGLIDQLERGTDESIVCQLSGLATGDQEELRIFDTSAGTIIDNAGFPFELNERNEMRYDRDQKLGCRDVIDGRVLALQGESTRKATAGQVGIRARGATARYHWILIVAGP